MFNIAKAVEGINAYHDAKKFSDANSEANQERRASEIERIAAESMLEGGEFYPFSKENFAEAVRNMPDEDMEALRYAYISVPANQTVESYLNFHEKFKEIMVCYWKKCALFDAAKRYKD